MGWIAVGVVGLALSFWGLHADVGFISQPFYAWAWWSYILLADGVVRWLGGNSLLTSRRDRVPSILLWSISFWFFFELLNVRYQNWYYVGVFGDVEGVDRLRSGAFGIVCFATVFMGLFESYDLLDALGLFRKARLAPRKLAPGVSYAVQAVGAAMVATSLLFPYYLAPLVWGSLTFLVDPWNYRRGARSLLADLERGRIDVLLRLVVAGALCGLLWESLNFLAPQKWIYTVRGLEELKLFEMPLLGFLGFPALALDAFAAYGAIAYLLYGNRSWEADEPATLRRRAPLSPRLRWAMLPLHLAFWGLVGTLSETRNIGSIELRLSHLEKLPPGAIETLTSAGVTRPRHLLRELERPERADALRRLLAVSPAALDAIHQEARLFDLKGIGYHHGRMLQNAGFRRVEDLRDVEPESTYAILTLAPRPPFPSFRPEMLRVWVRAARDAR